MSVSGEPIEGALRELRARVRALAERRADVAWNAFHQRVDTSSIDVVLRMQQACEERTGLAWVHRVLRGFETDEHPWTALSSQRVVFHLGKLVDPVETVGPSPRALAALDLFRRHTCSVRELFGQLKSDLWLGTAMVTKLLAEATARLVKLRCGRGDVERLRLHLARQLGPPAQLSLGPDLQAAMEQLAVWKLLAALNGASEACRSSESPPRPTPRRTFRVRRLERPAVGDSVF